MSLETIDLDLLQELMHEAVLNLRETEGTYSEKLDIVQGMIERLNYEDVDKIPKAKYDNCMKALKNGESFEKAYEHLVNSANDDLINFDEVQELIHQAALSMTEKEGDYSEKSELAQNMILALGFGENFEIQRDRFKACIELLKSGRSFENVCTILQSQ